MENVKGTSYMVLVNLSDYELLAQEVMSPEDFDFYYGGSDDEQTLHDNRAAFKRIHLRPRMLVDVSNINMETHLLGTPVSMPIFVAPTAYQGIASPDAERATARGTEKAGTLMVSSINSSTAIEEIAQSTSGPLWQQMYLSADHDHSKGLLQRAEAAGYSAIVLTIDRARYGNRERDRRNAYTLPASANHFVSSGLAPRSVLSPVTWDDIGQIRSWTKLPLILKGVMTAEDAARALDYEVDGIIVSNHGGRQLDGLLATIDVLPEIVKAVNGRCEVYVDGGIRRGTDVLKALALGAKAVLVGRPILWGLAVDGEAGVLTILQMLQKEFELAMALAGCPTLASIDRSLVQWSRPKDDA
jgi:isopentenyl diphosphate isomerase/L-lactate dehydrogenase-like FMN-dependent dehydrogenase